MVTAINMAAFAGECQAGFTILNDPACCEREKRCAALQPGRRHCACCGTGGPVSAAYGHDCGSKTA